MGKSGVIDIGILEFEDIVDPVQEVFNEFERHWIDPFNKILEVEDDGYDLQLLMIADLFVKNGPYPMEMEPLSADALLSMGDIPSRFAYYRALQYDALKKMTHWNVICVAYSAAPSVFDSEVVRALIEAIRVLKK